MASTIKRKKERKKKKKKGLTPKFIIHTIIFVFIAFNWYDSYLQRIVFINQNRQSQFSPLFERLKKKKKRKKEGLNLLK